MGAMEESRLEGGRGRNRSESKGIRPLAGLCPQIGQLRLIYHLELKKKEGCGLGFQRVGRQFTQR